MKFIMNFINLESNFQQMSLTPCSSTIFDPENWGSQVLWCRESHRIASSLELSGFELQKVYVELMPRQIKGYGMKLQPGTCQRSMRLKMMAVHLIKVSKTAHSPTAKLDSHLKSFMAFRQLMKLPHFTL